MKEYRFYIYLYFSNIAVDSVFHSVFAKNYRSAYKQLLAEIPHNYLCEYFVVSPRYRVDGKERSTR